ncbi:MAG: hypothetical protein M3328_18210 [Chloroflexota bacterium]|nr:hypothetical protein [Chloroflexota bacterium]
MDGEQPGEDRDSVRRDREDRGVVRDAHLQAAREHAQRANAEARERSAVEPRPEEDEAVVRDEAQDDAVENNNEAAMKAQARARYEGSDDSFEQEWPAIRERLVEEDLRKGVERLRRRL